MSSQASVSVERTRQFGSKMSLKGPRVKGLVLGLLLLESGRNFERWGVVGGLDIGDVPAKWLMRTQPLFLLPLLLPGHQDVRSLASWHDVLSHQGFEGNRADQPDWSL